VTDYLAVCARLMGNELVAAECENLTGGKPEADGVANCRSVELIRRSAYIRTGLRLIAHAEKLDELLQMVAGLTFEAEDFSIEYLKLAERKTINGREAAIQLANIIPAYPKLAAPRHRFLLIERNQGVWFGEILAEAEVSYTKHDAKPFRTSTSLPSRLARALVNLVTPPARIIFDPCCGTGTILLEAQALGLQCFGVDWNPRMAGMSRKNLEHFGYSVDVTCANFMDITRQADAIVTDLPYGLFMHAKAENLQAVIRHAHALAPKAVFVSGEDITSWLQEAGYRSIEVYRVLKHPTFSRYVHVGQSSRFA
jgi:tRNA G10  N-methylase Trm11